MNNKLAMLLPVIIYVLVTACNNNKNQEEMNNYKTELSEIFPKGEKGSSETFTGNAYNSAWLMLIVFSQQPLGMYISNQAQEAIGTAILLVKS